MWCCCWTFTKSVNHQWFYRKISLHWTLLAHKTSKPFQRYLRNSNFVVCFKRFLVNRTEVYYLTGNIIWYSKSSRFICCTMYTVQCTAKLLKYLNDKTNIMNKWIAVCVCVFFHSYCFHFDYARWFEIR